MVPRKLQTYLDDTYLDLMYLDIAILKNVLESPFNKHLQRCFPVKFPKLLGTPLVTKHLQWLLPNDQQSM